MDNDEKDENKVSEVLFEQKGQNGNIPWCSYKFTVTGEFSSINVATSKGNKTMTPLTETKTNFASVDGTAMFGVVVTGIDAIDTITVTAQ